MNLNLAKELIDAAEKEAASIDVQMVISIVDAGVCRCRW